MSPLLTKQSRKPHATCVQVSAINTLDSCFYFILGACFACFLIEAGSREREENLARKIAQSSAASLALTTNTLTARILQLLRCSHRIGMARGSECDAGERIFPHYSCGRVCCVVVFGMYGEKQQRIVSFHFVFNVESVKNGRRFGLEFDVSSVNFPEFLRKTLCRGNCCHRFSRCVE